MKFNIIQKDWYKRRSATQKILTPVCVSIPDYQQIHNHFCDMYVTYNDDSVEKLKSRVIQHSITKQWTVDGMKVAVRVME